LEVFQLMVVDHAEEVRQLLVVLLEAAGEYLLALEVGEAVYEFCA
jgi:hypothetical protein